MKVAIVTINDITNYGNRLQNYALQEFLKQNNIDSKTLFNERYSNDKSMYLFRYIYHLKYKYSKKYRCNEKCREDNFIDFEKNISYYPKKITAFSKKWFNEFDYFLVGSDQVWNPNFGRLRDVDLLSMVDSKKRVSFSASLGIDYIPQHKIRKIKKELVKFKAISVREENAKELIENVIGRKDIEVLVDPTMLLSADNWDKVAKKPEMLRNEKYILNYFLGELSESRRLEIERIAKENNCEIINILDKKSSFYNCGPSEFLYLEKNAFLICTDSFHSSVFAILYNRPFIIFDREQCGIEKMNSRIETLINKFKLKNRKYNGESITKENLEHDYSDAFKILEEERKKSLRFLFNALNIKDSD